MSRFGFHVVSVLGFVIAMMNMLLWFSLSFLAVEHPELISVYITRTPLAAVAAAFMVNTFFGIGLLIWFEALWKKNAKS